MENSSDEERKEFTIKINGWAYSKEQTDLDNVKSFDEFVEILFKNYHEALQEEFDKERELSYNSYLKNFSFDTVTKEVK